MTFELIESTTGRVVQRFETVSSLDHLLSHRFSIPRTDTQQLVAEMQNGHLAAFDVTDGLTVVIIPLL